MSRIAVLGAGSWGTALALNLCRRGDHEVALWAHTPSHAAALRDRRENQRYLPGFIFPCSLRVAGSLAEAAAGAQAILLVVPAEHMRATARAAAPFVPGDALVVSAAKGLEEGSLLRMTEVLGSVLHGTADGVLDGVLDRAPGPAIGALSGPSFAQEVARGAPAAVTVAFPRGEDAERARAMLTTDSLRLYRNTDVAGVELGGALKNVVALAAGAAAGLELGHNSVAALITRGIAEITRLALGCGGRRETLAGLAGLGDLVLTCTGALSRNRRVGVELGRGRALPAILEELDGKVAEGVRTTDAALALAERLGVEMPITAEVHGLLHGRRSAAEAVEALMSRPGRDE